MEHQEPLVGRAGELSEPLPLKPTGCASGKGRAVWSCLVEVWEEGVPGGSQVAMLGLIGNSSREAEYDSSPAETLWESPGLPTGCADLQPIGRARGPWAGGEWRLWDPGR